MKKILSLIFSITLSAGAFAKSTSNSSLTRLCTNTANSYPYSRDRLLYQEYGDLFTADAEFQIGDGPKVVGKKAIVDALKQRGPTMTTRHVSQVVHMRETDDRGVEGISYVMIFKNEPDNLEMAVHPWIIAEYHDQFSISENRCLIKSRKVEIVFRRP